MYQEVKKVAENRIVCDCGNNDWTAFVYVGLPPQSLIAACKRCGSIHRLEGQGWDTISGPIKTI